MSKNNGVSRVIFAELEKLGASIPENSRSKQCAALVADIASRTGIAPKTIKIVFCLSRGNEAMARRLAAGTITPWEAMKETAGRNLRQERNLMARFICEYS